jgi:hypothetical protein
MRLNGDVVVVRGLRTMICSLWSSFVVVVVIAIVVVLYAMCEI